MPAQQDEQRRDHQMTERHRERAEKVVESFRALLGQELLEAIPENDFEQLRLYVQEALADELHDAAERLEELARVMRRETSLSDAGGGLL
jgi:hypothetical protein